VRRLWIGVEEILEFLQRCRCSFVKFVLEFDGRRYLGVGSGILYDMYIYVA